MSSVPASQDPSHGGRWQVIAYALDSNPRTLRFCLIWFVMIACPVAATVITLLMRHVLLCGLRAGPLAAAIGGGQPGRLA